MLSEYAEYELVMCYEIYVHEVKGEGEGAKTETETISHFTHVTLHTSQRAVTVLMVSPFPGISKNEKLQQLRTHQTSTSSQVRLM